VGFTNGCFDIVHAGHIELLQGARATCDRLVVGLNSDASVSRLKGAERPVQGEVSRASVLAALACVDLVVIFDEDTPLNLISTLLPTDLIKGADYSEESVVGAPIVKAGGGRVHLINLVPGLSTTNAINRIRQSDDTAGPRA
jgi:D-beta-D-heptose 7-phosphate kinase/D-beta-D-heptose 1-phosphate adenosyltransferase